MIIWEEIDFCLAWMIEWSVMIEEGVWGVWEGVEEGWSMYWSLRWESNITAAIAKRVPSTKTIVDQVVKWT